MPEEVVEEKAPKAKKPIFLYVIVGLVLVLGFGGRHRLLCGDALYGQRQNCATGTRFPDEIG